MKTRKNSTTMLVLIVAVMFGAWAVIISTPALAEDKIKIQEFAFKDLSFQSGGTMGEYYANLYGGVTFDNDAMSVSGTPSALGWSTIGEYYANLYGGVTFNNNTVANQNELASSNYSSDGIFD